MFAAGLTTLCWAFAALFSQRSIRVLGSVRANLGRLVVAFICLGAYAHVWGLGLGGAGRDLFLWSGVIGMGLGDLALFAAIPRLGARLTILMCQCIAVPVAMVTEWAWLGTRLSGAEILWATVILAGVTLALMPSPRHPPSVPVTKLGLLMGVLAALGQGWGAVISRRGYELTTAAGEHMDGITAAYQRITGGLLITASYFLVIWWLERRRRQHTQPPAESPPRPEDRRQRRRAGWGYMIANAFFGPVAGVSCYQWALATTPSGIVLPIVATTPLVIIPLTYWFEGDRPSKRSLAGGVVAVAGVILLTVVR